MARLELKDPSLYPEDKIKERDHYQERISIVKKVFGGHFSNPYVKKPLVSLSMTPLSKKLKFFKSQASDSMSLFIDEIITKKSSFYEIASAKSQVVHNEYIFVEKTQMLSLHLIAFMQNNND